MHRLEAMDAGTAPFTSAEAKTDYSGDSAANSPRTALVDPLSVHGGMHYYTHDLAGALAQQGIETLVVAPSAQALLAGPYAFIAGFDGAYGKDSKLVRGFRLLNGYRKAAVQARRFGASFMIFHIFKSDAFELAGILMARRQGIRPIVIVHDVFRLDKTTRFSFLQTIARNSHAIITHNQFSSDGIAKACPGFTGKIINMPHGNYVSHFSNPLSKDEAKVRLSIDPVKKVLLFFGNPRREKGLDVLLRALPPFAKREDFCVLVAGKMKPDEEREHREFVRAQGLDHIVRFDIGHVADDMVQSYYCAADIVAQPYRRVYESGVALMAASLGRPILASNLPVFAEMISAGMGGMLFDPSSDGALQSAIDDILTGKVDLEAMGAKALQYAMTQRDWRNVSAPVAEEMRNAV